MGYKEPSAPLTGVSASNATNALTQPIASKFLSTANMNALSELTESNAIKFKANCPMPDEMQMLPFKPVRNACRHL